MVSSSELQGRWRRVSGGDCANAYPAQIVFEQARYLGTKDRATQGFIVWDAGGFRVESADVVMIQTADDAQVRYRYKLSGGRLTFVDEAGCEFSYERDEAAPPR